MSITRAGTPAVHISEIDSCISESPWPVEPVAALAPVAAAPQVIPIASSSLSAFMNTPSTTGSLAAMCSRISVKGVMG
jgi:hypothetical protein